jgi:hypothetical protein
MNSLSSTTTDEIQMSAIGANMRSEKIERARCVAAAIREQRQQQQQALEGKHLANEGGLTELRKMVDAWKGDKILLQKLEAVVLMKKKECKKTRKLVAEAINEWGSVPQSPDSPSAIQKQPSSKSKKASTRRHLMLQTQSSEHSVRLVPKVVVLMKEREKLPVEGNVCLDNWMDLLTERVVAPSA